MRNRQSDRFGRDQRGTVGVMSALTMTMALGFTAIATDAGLFYYQKRRQQTATDLAALAAAMDIANAPTAASANARDNGFSSANISSVELGTYVGDPSLPPAQRFTAGTPTQNAARVTMQSTAPAFFGRIMPLLKSVAVSPATAAAAPAGASPDADAYVITTHATATQNPQAAFAIGSRLVSLNGGIENAILGSLLGTNLSLSAMDYQSLANVQIDMFAFSDALARHIGLTAVTYDQLLATNVAPHDLMAAVADVLGTGSAAANALSGIVAGASSATRVPVSTLVSFGPYGGNTVGSGGPLTASVSALDMVSAVAQLANGRHQIETALALNVPGIAAASLQLAIGERPVGTSFVTVGSQSASAHTAQTRLLLTVKIGMVGQTSLVSLPIYIEVASGTAVLSAVSCSPGAVSSSSVTLGVTPGVIDGWIGAVSDADFTNFTSAPQPAAAPLLFTGLANVTGRAHATISNLTATPVSFSYADIAAATKHTTSTTDFIASLLGKLTGDLQLSVSLVGLNLFLPSGLTEGVGQVVATAAAPVDQVLNSVLSTLGVGLGQADTWVTGVRCGSATLVN